MLTGSTRSCQKISVYYESDRWEHRIARRELRRCKSVCELGCGTGVFLPSLVRYGHEVAGVELNPLAAAQAREVGLNVLESRAQSPTVNSKEHLMRYVPSKCWNKCPTQQASSEQRLKLVKRRGKLIFAVPNADGLRGSAPISFNIHRTMCRGGRAIVSELGDLFPLRLEKVLSEPLARDHIDIYLAWNARHLRQRSGSYRLIFNRVTIPIYRRLLSRGLRRFSTGHALYAQFTCL